MTLPRFYPFYLVFLFLFISLFNDFISAVVNFLGLTALVPLAGLLEKALFSLIIISSFLLIIKKKFNFYVFDKRILATFSAVLLIGFLSCLSLNHDYSIFILQTILTFQGVILFFAIINLELSFDDIVKVERYFVIFIKVILFISLVNIIFPTFFTSFWLSYKDVELSLYRGDGGRAALMSIFPHPGLLGWFSSLSALFFFSKLLLNKFKKVDILYFLFSLIVLLMTFRRKSILAFVIVCFIAILLFSNKTSSKFIRGGSIFAIFAFISILFLDEIMVLFNDTYSKYVLASGENEMPRIILAQAGYEIAKDYFPLGVAPGYFGSWMSSVNYSYIYDLYDVSGYWGLSKESPMFLNDTYWPMIIAEFGFLGGALTLFMWYFFYSKSITFLKSGIVNNKNYFSCFILLALLELLIESIATPSLSRSPQITIIMTLLALILNKERIWKNV
ncbi:hypothetical protein [Pseudoalteromonas distincta]|uniref:hypothetical protein n=1 Tax=Pseudoalteromonas distincta TaxID=77608 RepID=UPI0011F34EC5|nr:hypothetical protein [Pseudoalteromonas distincta]KAA1162950.1 hypothetical protein EU511_02315 [Pseudoalteromonas distincta]